MNSNMQNSRKWLGASALCFGLIALQGCFFDTDDGHDHGSVVSDFSGNLIVDWTIERARDPFECDDYDAPRIAIDITTPAGRPISSFTQDCAAFATTIALDEGDYAGTATLLDSSRRERTTTVDLGDFSIFDGEDTVVEINFPFDSFL